MEDIGLPEMSLSSNALHHAVRAGSVASVKFLLWTGANVNSRDCRKKTALHYACRSEDEDMQRVVEVLLEAEAEVNAQSLIGETPLHEACKFMNTSAVITLLRNGAKINLVDDVGMTPLQVVIHKATKNRDAMSTFVAFLTNITAEGFEGGDVVSVVKSRDKSGETALHLASALNIKEVVCTLLRLGAEVGVKSNAGMTALHWAARACAGNVVETLVHNGGDVNAKNSEGDTPLHLACSRTDVGCQFVFSGSLCRTIEELLCWGAKVYEKNTHQRTTYEELYNEENELVIEEDDAKVIETTFIKHVIRLTTLNLEKGFDTSWILGPEFYEQVKKQCFKEIKDMKSSMLVKDISLYEVLSQTNQPFLLSANDLRRICEVLCSPDLLTRFPLYGRTLRTTFQRPKLLTRAVLSFHNERRKQMVKELPYPVAQHLVSFLCNEDLKSFIKSE